MSWPQLVRDAVGLHLVWGDWMVSRSYGQRRWPVHLTQYANMGQTRIDHFFWLGLRAMRVKRELPPVEPR